jgi:hypothetical protein
METTAWDQAFKTPQKMTDWMTKTNPSKVLPSAEAELGSTPNKTRPQKRIKSSAEVVDHFKNSGRFQNDGAIRCLRWQVRKEFCLLGKKQPDLP